MMHVVLLIAIRSIQCLNSIHCNFNILIKKRWKLKKVILFDIPCVTEGTRKLHPEWSSMTTLLYNTFNYALTGGTYLKREEGAGVPPWNFLFCLFSYEPSSSQIFFLIGKLKNKSSVEPQSRTLCDIAFQNLFCH